MCNTKPESNDKAPHDQTRNICKINYLLTFTESPIEIAPSRALTRNLKGGGAGGVKLCVQGKQWKEKASIRFLERLKIRDIHDLQVGSINCCRRQKKYTMISGLVRFISLFTTNFFHFYKIKSNSQILVCLSCIACGSVRSSIRMQRRLVLQ